MAILILVINGLLGKIPIILHMLFLEVSKFPTSEHSNEDVPEEVGDDTSAAWTQHMQHSGAMQPLFLKGCKESNHSEKLSDIIWLLFKH